MNRNKLNFILKKMHIKPELKIKIIQSFHLNFIKYYEKGLKVKTIQSFRLDFIKYYEMD